MASPPLVPEFAIDQAHLERMTLGDVALEREVLRMFSAQAASVVALLASWPDDAAVLAHTLKGSARAIGAFAVADAAGELEDVIRQNGDAADLLEALEAAVDLARDAIADRLER
ncbi:Hpt domain-containing protein [Rhodopseudomonas sp. HC1]|uniref:Hpt domain-containing protein n=1 Tax=Rhodopseudomonas infernalis TaxID=2897386 RepID=UPI001EE8A068|nr:Hpt domain-containing protein [Rhodopseudomonas infernalis]MCG6203329.1 Hpt domain-containing protein [Rhodopseudomonas infernalis]